MQFKKILLNDRAKAGAWLLQFVQTDQKKLWLGLGERDSEFLPKLWRLIFKENTIKSALQSIFFWTQNPPFTYVKEISPLIWNIHEGSKILYYLPTPSNEWCVVESEEK